MKRAVIYFKDMTVDWVDPLHDEKKDIVYGKKYLTIDNGYHKYKYLLSKVKTISVTEVDELSASK